MTDRLGGSGHGARFNPIGPLGAPNAIGPADGAALKPRPQPAGPRFAADQLEISEQSRAYYAALVDGTEAPGVDPDMLLHLQLVHGPSSPLFEALRGTAAGQERLALPAGPSPEPPAGAPAEGAGPLAGFFSRALAEAGFAWRNFAESQRW